jgi:hypothetical protein
VIIELDLRLKAQLETPGLAFNTCDCEFAMFGADAHCTAPMLLFNINSKPLHALY